MQSGGTGNNSIDCSVIITTRDRARVLEKTLNALAVVKVESISWELVIVDNASSDETSSLIQEYAGILPIKPMYCAEHGKTKAQNVALREARGALLIFTDDDVEFEQDWIREYWRAACEWPDADLFGGAIDIHLPEELPDWLRADSAQAVIRRQCAYYAPAVCEGYTSIPPIGPNMAVRRHVARSQAFDERVGPDGTANYIKGGDTDFNEKLMRQAHRCVYLPSARVSHSISVDQLNRHTLFKGVFRRGRKNAYIDVQNGLSLRSALRNAQISVFRRWARYQFSYACSPIDRYRLGEKLHFKRGYLHQLLCERRS